MRAGSPGIPVGTSDPLTAMSPIDLEYRVLSLERNPAEARSEVAALRQTVDALLSMASAEAREPVSA